MLICFLFFAESWMKFNMKLKAAPGQFSSGYKWILKEKASLPVSKSTKKP